MPGDAPGSSRTHSLQDPVAGRQHSDSGVRDCMRVFTHAGHQSSGCSQEVQLSLINMEVVEIDIELLISLVEARPVQTQMSTLPLREMS